jgi:1,4-dihydroxy-2-naphthoate octaprenyltransferase
LRGLPQRRKFLAEAVTDEDVERRLREQVEQAIGRRVSDQEWEAFKLARLQRAQSGSWEATSPPKAGVFARAAGFLAGLAGVVALPLLAGLLVAVVFGGLIAGLAWAYDPGALDRSGFGGDVVGGVFGLWFVGWLVWSAWSNWRRATPILLALALLIGLVALAIGALIRAAGG